MGVRAKFPRESIYFDLEDGREDQDCILTDSGGPRRSAGFRAQSEVFSGGGPSIAVRLEGRSRVGLGWWRRR